MTEYEFRKKGQRRKMEAEQTIHRCYHCNAEYIGNYCPECGAKWCETAYCPECGALYDGKSKFCTNCGYSYCGEEPYKLPETPEQIEIKSKVIKANEIAAKQGANAKSGRPNYEYTERFMSVVLDYVNRKISLKRAMELTGLKRSAFYYHLTRLKQFGVIESKSAKPE